MAVVIGPASTTHTVGTGAGTVYELAAIRGRRTNQQRASLEAFEDEAEALKIVDQGDFIIIEHVYDLRAWR